MTFEQFMNMTQEQYNALTFEEYHALELQFQDQLINMDCCDLTDNRLMYDGPLRRAW